MDNVPSGQWVYEISTVQQNWSGPSGTPSSTVTVP